MLLKNTEVCVLITGVGSGSLGRELIKSFKMAVHPYKLIATDISQKSIGLFETPYRYLVPPASSEDYINKILKISEKENVHAIVPGSEPEIEVISKNKKIFEEKGIKVLCNPWPVIEKCSDKYAINKFLEDKGVSCPKTILFEKSANVDDISSYPVIVKPRTGSGSRNVFIAHNSNEANFFANYLINYGSKPVIQEYLPNNDGEYTIGVLYANNGKLKTSIAMKRILSGGLSTRQIIKDPLTNKENVVSSSVSQGLFEEFTEVKKVGEKIAQIVEADGPINIQCRKTESGIVPFEINPRFSGTNALRSLVGHNEPDILCRYLLFGEIPEIKTPKFGYVFRDLKEVYISKEEIEKVPKS